MTQNPENVQAGESQSASYVSTEVITKDNIITTDLLNKCGDLPESSNATQLPSESQNPDTDEAVSHQVSPTIKPLPACDPSNVGTLIQKYNFISDEEYSYMSGRLPPSKRNTIKSLDGQELYEIVRNKMDEDEFLNLICDYRKIDANSRYEWSSFVSEIIKKAFPDTSFLIKLMSRVLAYVSKGSKSVFVTKDIINNRVSLTIHSPTKFLSDCALHTFKLPVKNDEGEIVGYEDMSIKELVVTNLKAVYYDSIIFRPFGLNEDYFCPPNQLNLFTGFQAKLVNIEDPNTLNKIGMILNHIYECLTKSETKVYEYLIKWLATLVQYPIDKHGVCPLIIGEQGSGKGCILTWIIRQIIGMDYGIYIDKLEHVVGKFNSSIINKVLVYCDEVCSKKDDEMLSLKALLTEDARQMERKGIDPITISDYSHFIMSTNTLVPFKLPEGDRRFFIIETSDKYCKNFVYFKKLNADLNEENANIFYSYLMGIDLTGFEVRTIPKTGIKDDIIDASVPEPVRFIKQFRWIVADNDVDQVTSRILFRMYEIYCETNGIKPGTINMFTRQVKTAKNEVTTTEGRGSATIFHRIHKNKEIDEEEEEILAKISRNSQKMDMLLI